MAVKSTDKPTFESAPAKRLSLGGVLWTGLLCLVFYLLSTGPAFRLAAAYPGCERGLRVYDPLFWVLDRSPGDLAKPVVDWYIQEAWKAPRQGKAKR